MKIPLWAVPTFHGVHTLHAKICYAVSCDMDAMERIFTGQSSQQVMCEFSPEPRLRLLFVAVGQSQKYQDAEDQLVVKRKAIATWRDIRGRRPES